MAKTPSITERQKKWFRSVEEGILRDTGKSVDDWAAIARECPEDTPRGRVKWFKDTYGIGVNRASTILDRAFPGALGWDDPQALIDRLWSDPGARAIYEKVAGAAARLQGVTVGARKGFVGFSRKVQFAAIRPVKIAGRMCARLGLAIPLPEHPRLEAPKKSEGWSERLRTIVMLAAPGDVDAELKGWLREAYDRS